MRTDSQQRFRIFDLRMLRYQSRKSVSDVSDVSVNIPDCGEQSNDLLDEEEKSIW